MSLSQALNQFAQNLGRYPIRSMAVISSIVEGLERRGRHNVNRVAVSCVVLNNELFIFVYPLQHMVVDQHMTQPFLFRCLNH